jgi:hypothetical protein
MQILIQQVEGAAQDSSVLTSFHVMPMLPMVGGAHFEWQGLEHSFSSFLCETTIWGILKRY